MTSASELSFGVNSRLTSLSRVKVPAPAPAPESADDSSLVGAARLRRLSDNLPIRVATAMISLCFGAPSIRISTEISPICHFRAIRW